MLEKHLAGKRLTRDQAIVAKCCDCMGGFADGRVDCEIPTCSLYPFMPYRKDKSNSARARGLKKESRPVLGKV